MAVEQCVNAWAAVGVREDNEVNFSRSLNLYTHGVEMLKRVSQSLLLFQEGMLFHSGLDRALSPFMPL